MEGNGKIHLYTDGAASGNPGPGGYGIVLKCGNYEKELSGGFRFTTNNRMELLAVIKGLEALRRDNSEVEVVSDSTYVIRAVNDGWLEKWHRNGFRKVKNVDLWKRFLELSSRHRLHFSWVRGHAGHPYNERCDALAVAAYGAADLPEDYGYVAGRDVSDTSPLMLFGSGVADTFSVTDAVTPLVRNVLVTGANGQLGNEIRLLAPEHPGWNFIFTDISDHPDGLPVTRLDVTTPLVFDRPLDCIINCAAYTNVDKAESDEPSAYRLNCTAVKNLASLALEKGAALIHVSTDYVFDGTKEGPYTEEDAPCPVSVYGRTKLAGEQAVAESGCRYVIIRTAWLYSEFGRNFVKTMLKLSSEQHGVKVVDDQKGSPTYALDLAAAILSVMEAGICPANQGIYDFSGGGECTWFDLADAVASASGHPGVIVPCTSEEYASNVSRPANSVLDKGKIIRTFGVAVPYWRDSLAECLKRLQTQLH